MKNKKAQYDYGKCHICGEQMKEKLVNQEFWIKGKLLVIEDVPAGVCPRCGEKVVKANIGREIATLIEDSKRLRKARIMRVPVLRFVKETEVA